MLVHEGPARVFNSEEEAVNAIFGKKINKGDVIVIRYEGPKADLLSRLAGFLAGRPGRTDREIWLGGSRPGTHFAVAFAGFNGVHQYAKVSS